MHANTFLTCGLIFILNSPLIFSNVIVGLCIVFVFKLLSDSMFEKSMRYSFPLEEKIHKIYWVYWRDGIWVTTPLVVTFRGMVYNFAENYLRENEVWCIIVPRLSIHTWIIPIKKVINTQQRQGYKVSYHISVFPPPVAKR